MRKHVAALTFFTLPLSAPHHGHSGAFLVISVILRRSRVRLSESVRGSRIALRSPLRSSGLRRTREHTLQMFWSSVMVAFRKPMWKTGSSSGMYPQCPGHSLRLRPHVPHPSLFPLMPSRESSTPNGAGSRFGGSRYSSRDVIARCAPRCISSPVNMQN
jgi:hypothetical protein